MVKSDVSTSLKSLSSDGNKGKWLQIFNENKLKHDVLLFTLETKSSKKLIPRVESSWVLSEALSSLMKTFHTEDNQS